MFLILEENWRGQSCVSVSRESAPAVWPWPCVHACVRSQGHPRPNSAQRSVLRDKPHSFHTARSMLSALCYLFSHPQMKKCVDRHSDGQIDAVHRRFLVDPGRWLDERNERNESSCWPCGWVSTQRVQLLPQMVRRLRSWLPLTPLPHSTAATTTAHKSNA